MFMLVSGYALRANPTYPCSTGLDRDNSIYFICACYKFIALNLFLFGGG